MNIDKHLSQAGLLVTRDAVDVEHIRFSADNKSRVRRFAAFQIHALALERGLAGAACACLIGFDMVRPSCVASAMLAIPVEFRAATYLYWSHGPDKQADRRQLSNMTVLHWGSMVENSAAMNAFTAWLCSLGEYKEMTPITALAELELDLLSWSARKLPMALFAHVSGLRQMTPLSDETLARMSTKSTPVMKVDDKHIEREALVSDFLDVVDEVDDEKCRPADSSSVALAVQLLTTRNGETPDQTIDRWVSSLLNLRKRVASTNIASAIVLSWMLDICESGTAKKTDADYKTRRRYCVVTAMPLWRMLSAIGGHPESWEQQALHAGYIAAMEDPSIADKNALGAGLSSFQGFLNVHWDIDLPALALHKLIPLPRPRAQYVTKVESNRAIEWTSKQKGGDTRLLKMAALAVALGAAAPFRIRELLYLRLGNITRLEDGSFEIEIVRFGWRNKLKSAAAVRRVRISDPCASQLLVEHFCQRIDEGTSSKDLLFASPLSPTGIYRQHALQRTILRVLKLATGDPDMTFHALRHTWASNAVAEVLSTNSIVDFNRLIHIAEQMGHVTPATTLYFYAHFFEDAIHTHVSAALRESLDFTPAVAQALVGIKPNTLGTAARRHGLTIEAKAWTEICNAAQQVVFHDVSRGMQLIDPSCPVLSSAVTEGLTPLRVLEALSLLCNPVLTDALVAARAHISIEQTANIRTAVCEIARSEMSRLDRKKSPHTIESAGAALETMNIHLGSECQPKFAKLRTALAVSIDAELAARAASSWLSIRDRGYLSMECPEQLMGMLHLMKSAGVTATDLAVCQQSLKANETRAMQQIAQVHAEFHNVWNAAPSFFKLNYVHPARPDMFLIWPNSSDCKSLPGPAGRTVTGLQALMLSVAVFSMI